MPERRKYFDRETKIKAVNQVISGEKTMGQIAREFDIVPSVVSRWRSEYLNKSNSAFPGGSRKDTDTIEVQKLVKQLREITKERDILRKVIALLYKRECLKDDI